MVGLRRDDALPLGLLTALITLLFADVLLGYGSFFVRDIVHYSYPLKKVLREVVLSGEFPYWNRFVSAGQPMAANPAHQVFYPLNWLILLPSYGWGFSLLVLIHVYVAAWSMYALLRSMELRPAAAFFGAVSFALGGIGLSYLNLLPFLFIAAWMPLTCLYARRFLLRRSRRDFALAAFFLGLQMVVGEPSTVLQTGLLMGAYALYRGAAERSMKRGLHGVLLIAGLTFGALLVAAVQILPAIDHASDSVRSRGFPFAVVADWSMPPARIGELIYPNLLGNPSFDGPRRYWGAALYGTRRAPFLFSIYPSLLMSVLATAGVLARVRGSRFVLAIVSASVLLAVGAHTPLWSWLHQMGIARSLRYPEKFILMGVFAVIVFGAHVLDLLLSGDEHTRRKAVGVVLVVTGIAGICAIVSLTSYHAPLFASVWQPSARSFDDLLRASRTGWMIATVRGVILLVLLRALTRIRRPYWLMLLGGLVALDLAALAPQVAPRIDRAYFDTTPALARQLPSNRADYRLYHHAALHTRAPQIAAYFAPDADLYWTNRNAMLPLSTATHGVRTVLDGDYDLTSLETTADFVEAMRAVARSRKDWTDVMASMSNAWFGAVFVPPREAFTLARGDRRLLEPVRILPFERYGRYYFADRVEGIRDKNDFVEKVVSRRFSKGTAFVSGASFNPAPGRVNNVFETANSARIEVETAGRAFLVISVTPHRYWRLTIDGVEAPAVVTNVGYQGVLVPSGGKHVIEMRYRNPLIPAGAAISALTLLALLLYGSGRSGLRSTTMRAL